MGPQTAIAGRRLGRRRSRDATGDVGQPQLRPQRKDSAVFADIQSSFGQFILYMFIAAGILGWWYRKQFPNNEPGEIAKKGFIDWLTKRLK
jgi:hypothetical protein